MNEIKTLLVFLFCLMQQRCLVLGVHNFVALYFRIKYQNEGMPQKFIFS